MSPKRNSPVAQGTCGRAKRAEFEPSTPVASMSTPMKKFSSDESSPPTVATATLMISQSTFGSPGSSIGKKLNFKDMDVADNDYSKDKDFIMNFDSWDDYQKLVNAVKHIFSGMFSSHINAMSYDQLVDFYLSF